MLLKKIIFDNYKTYYGHQEVNLYIPQNEREDGKNIILLGGLNGAGKTTILKAIIYTLFGKRGMTESEHKRLFSNVINYSFFDEGGRESSVILVLETDSGEEWTLKVKWYFDKYKRLTHEERDLVVSRPDSRKNKHARIDNIEVYNRFIDKIIPYHAAPFFIFDGEEIKEIILRQNSEEMKEAIHKITGMDAYKQLISDLHSLMNMLEKKLANSISHTKIKNFEENLDEVNRTLTIQESKKEKIITEIKRLESGLKQAKEDRNNKVLQNSKSRETLIKQQSQKETEYKIANDQLAEIFNENALSIILAEKITKLKKRLRIEGEIKRKRLVEETSLVPYRNFIEQLLDKNINPPLTKEQLEQIKELGKEIWKKENNINSTINEDFKELHDLSVKDQSYLMNYVVKDKYLITELLNKIEKTGNELQELEGKIRSAPETVNINEENKKIDSLTKMAGEWNLRLKSINKKIAITKNDKTDLLNKLSRLSGKEVNLEEIRQQHELLKRTIITIEQYIEEVTALKAEYIQEEFSSMLQRLFRKQDEFGKIEFDINTYTIRLYNDRMQEISIQDRSAGEMQMISSSLIWALTKASDLSLPIVVDTPLGRLDSHHRHSLIKHCGYFNFVTE